MIRHTQTLPGQELTIEVGYPEGGGDEIVRIKKYEPSASGSVVTATLQWTHDEWRELVKCVGIGVI